LGRRYFSAEAPERIFVSRGAVSHRVVVNEDELIEAAKSFGFTVVDPAKFTFEEQARIFSNAKVVAGAHGAAFTNLAFSQHRAALVLLCSEEVLDAFYWNIGCIRDDSLYLLTGEVVDRDPRGTLWSNYRIDRDSFARLLARIGGNESAIAPRNGTSARPATPLPTAFCSSTSTTRFPAEPSMPSTNVVLAGPGASRQFYCMEQHAGAGYLWVLSQAHALLKPDTYLEIGTESGSSLSLSKCASIGVDPRFVFRNTDFLADKSACMLFQMTSDKFFASYQPSQLLGKPIDMAFIDGMHLFEVVLRDFMNLERHCKRNSVVFFHDCIPTDSHIARRSVGDSSFQSQSLFPSWWAGDVWKAIAAMKRCRPDLRVRAFNAPPTGLVAVTNLDPASDALEREYFRLVDEFAELAPYGDDYEHYVAELAINDTSNFSSYDSISRLFWT